MRFWVLVLGLVISAMSGILSGLQIQSVFFCGCGSAFGRGETLKTNNPFRVQGSGFGTWLFMRYTALRCSLLPQSLAAETSVHSSSPKGLKTQSDAVRKTIQMLSYTQTPGRIQKVYPLMGVPLKYS